MHMHAHQRLVNHFIYTCVTLKQNVIHYMYMYIGETCTDPTTLARGAEGFRSIWLQILGTQLINRFPYIRYTNHKAYLLYVLLECVSESQVNGCVVCT